MDGTVNRMAALIQIHQPDIRIFDLQQVNDAFIDQRFFIFCIQQNNEFKILKQTRLSVYQKTI